MKNKSQFLALIKPLIRSLCSLDFEELKVDWYSVKVNIFYSAELQEWRSGSMEAESVDSFDACTGRFD